MKLAGLSRSFTEDVQKSMILTNPPIRMTPLERNRSCGSERNTPNQTKSGISNAPSTSPHRYGDQFLSTTSTNQGNRAKQPLKCAYDPRHHDAPINHATLSQSLGNSSILFSDRFSSSSTTKSCQRYENKIAQILFFYKQLAERLTSVSFS